MRRSTDLAPEYYERLPLAKPSRLLLWAVAVLLAAAALTLAIGFAETTAGSLAAGLLGSAAAVAAFAAYRLGSCEIRTTKAALHFGFGPLSAAYPVWGVRALGSRPATSWRRRFSDHELVVELEDPRGARQLAIPTREPEELAGALSALDDDRGTA